MKINNGIVSEFKYVKLGDKRLDNRLKSLVTSFLK